MTQIPEPVKADDGPEVDIELTIDDCQKRDLSKRYSKAFMGQFHYGTFYAYLKLKELEIQNIYHLAEIFNIDGFNKNHPAWRKTVPPFQMAADNHE